MRLLHLKEEPIRAKRFYMSGAGIHASRRAETRFVPQAFPRAALARSGRRIGAGHPHGAENRGVLN